MELDELLNMLSRAADNEIIQPSTTAIFLPFIFEKRNTWAVLLYLTLSVEPVISLIAWFQMKSLKQTNGNIKQNLLLRVRRLQSIFRSYIFLNAFFYLLLAIAVEYMISTKAVYHPVLEKIALPLRLIFYLLFIAFQYWQKKRSYLKNYGEYLSSITRLLNQIHED